MATHKIQADLDVDGEVQGTSLDINGNADISGTLNVTGTLTSAGNTVVTNGAPQLILKDSTDDDDHKIVFRSSSDADDYLIQTRDFTGAGQGDGMFIGSVQSDGEVCLVTHNTIALTLDTSQNATFAGSITGTSGTFSGNINANGNIVGDDGTNITNIANVEADVYAADADNTTKMQMNSTSIEFLVADSDVMDLNETTLNVSGTLVAKKRKLAITSSTDGNADGDIVYFGSTTSMDTGKIYYLNSSGAWALADADAESTAKGMLGVALGSASNTNGVLIRGMVTLDHDPGTQGDTLFLSTTAGTASSTAPSGNGDIVRVIGYCLNSSNGQVYFNPDGTFVEVTA